MATGYDVEVACTDASGTQPERQVINSVQVRRFKSWAPNASYYFWSDLSKYLKRYSEDFEIVHAHSYHAFPALYASQAKSRNRFVFTPHYHGRGHTFFQDLLHVPYKCVAKRMFQRADRVVCVSKYEESLVKNQFMVEDRKIVIIPNGVDPSEFGSLSKKMQGSGKVILYVGRLERYKGVEYVIQSLPHLDEDVRLEVVGTGPHQKALAELACRLGVTSRLSFSKNLSRQELLQRYSAAQLFVLLSRYESYGMSVGHASA